MRRQFDASLLWSLDDPLVPYAFLECVLAAYLEGDSPQKNDIAGSSSKATDPLCSPAAASDDLLRQLPRTRIVVGDKDPLHDQVVRFSHRIASLGVDARLTTYSGMPHGFLSFGWPVIGVPEVRRCVDDCSLLLVELLAGYSGVRSSEAGAASSGTAS